MREHMTPLQSIRLNCLQCMGGDARQVKSCDLDKGANPCPLWPYRMGHNPARAGIGANSHSYKKAASTKDLEAENANTENGV